MTSRLKEKTFKKYKNLDQRYETIGKVGEGAYGVRIDLGIVFLTRSRLSV